MCLLRRDALETCGELTGMGRESCFAQFGCSSDRVTTYFTAVEAMERAFEREGELVVSILTYRKILSVCSKQSLGSACCVYPDDWLTTSGLAYSSLLAWGAEEGDEDDYVPDKNEHQLPNPLGFVWRS